MFRILSDAGLSWVSKLTRFLPMSFSLTQSRMGTVDSPMTTSWLVRASMR